MAQDGTDVDAGFSLLTAHDLLSKDVDELKALVTQRREAEAKRDKDRSRAAERERPVKAERRAVEDKAAAGARPPAPGGRRRRSCTHCVRTRRQP